MKIHELIAAGPTRSFEFFPPKTDEGRSQLEATLDELEAITPSFVSVTYGAGGTTRDLTRDLVVGINATHPYPAMPHLTCMGHTSAQIQDMLRDYAKSGITNILALAGDPPADGSPVSGDFHYASDLIEVARSVGQFSVGVAAFPEGHPRSASLTEDRRNLAAKLEGADFGITQFFFDADHYSRMVDDLAALGCETPVLPGIMPMLNPATIRRFAEMNRASFPEELADRVERAVGDDRMAIAVDSAVQLCETLQTRGAPGLHLYCLNRSEGARRILEAVQH